MGFIIKINTRESDTGNPVKDLRKFNNIELHLKFNSLGSTFSFDFYFDPKDTELAEIICVSHLHECIIYWSKNEDSNYQPKESERVLTGFLMTNRFKSSRQKNWASCSGYSKPAVLNDCEFYQTPNEYDNLPIKDIIKILIKDFNLYKTVGDKTNKTGLLVDKKAYGVSRTFKQSPPKTIFATAEAEKLNSGSFIVGSPGENIDKSTEKFVEPNTSNIGSYLSDMCKSRNIVLSHNEDGNVYVTTPNTKGNPILKFNFTEDNLSNDSMRFKAVEAELNFNGQALHSHITAVQLADQDEGINGGDETVRNPLLPVGRRSIFRPKRIITNTSDRQTVGQAALYELGREIREAITLTVIMFDLDIDGVLIKPNNTIEMIDPNLFLYKFTRDAPTWFIQDVVLKESDDTKSAQLNCVLPFGYDYDSKKLENVFVKKHENIPRT